MTACSRCGATFQCGQSDPQATGACWCMALPPALPVPGFAPGPVPGPVPASADADGVAPVTAGCWCPACLHAHIASLQRPAP